MRGDPYRLKASRDARGHEQAGARYAVVVQQVRLGEFAGRLTTREMQDVDAALPAVLALD